MIKRGMFPLSTGHRSPLVGGKGYYCALTGGGEMRKEKLATFLGSTLTLLSAVAYAGSAPTELCGKSITVAWSETLIQRAESEQGIRNFGWSAQMNIYVSTAGRPFVRVIGCGMGGYNARREGVGTRGDRKSVV